VSALPGVRTLASYESAWLPKDVVAGMVLATMLVPQGMAYAELAGLPPITGLYTSILCLLGYEKLNARGVSLVFVDLKDPVKAKIERYELIRTIDPGHFFPTVGAAVDAFRQGPGVGRKSGRDASAPVGGQ